jgi:hypothetical protein
MRGYARIPADSGLRGTLASVITDSRGASSTGAARTRMPTKRPRYTVTDTGELSDQLDQAHQRWPEIRDRKELLLKLVAARRDAIEDEATDRAGAAEETAGALSGVYEPDELEKLRRDWCN